MKKISCECIKEMPCTLKFAYVLIVILFIMNIANCIRVKKIENKKSNLNTEMAAWIDKNPEAILQSVNKYVSKQQEEMQKKQQESAGQNISKFQKQLSDTKYAGVLNPTGTKEIIEFYDYNCGYCKMASKNVEELLKTRKDVRVILRSIPILGEASRYASEVETAILISNPEKYSHYYKALMEGSARTKEGVVSAVEKAGLKMSKIEKVLEKNKAEIAKIIEENSNLARDVGVNGTPAFIINGILIPGAIDAKSLEQKIDNK